MSKVDPDQKCGKCDRRTMRTSGFCIKCEEVDPPDPEDAAQASFAELARRLAEHDWTYEMSDDHGMWRRGTEQKRMIRTLLVKCAALNDGRTRRIYEKLCPQSFIETGYDQWLARGMRKA